METEHTAIDFEAAEKILTELNALGFSLVSLKYSKKKINGTAVIDITHQIVDWYGYSEHEAERIACIIVRTTLSLEQPYLDVLERDKTNSEGGNFIAAVQEYTHNIKVVEKATTLTRLHHPVRVFYGQDKADELIYRLDKFINQQRHLRKLEKSWKKIILQLLGIKSLY